MAAAPGDRVAVVLKRRVARFVFGGIVAILLAGCTAADGTYKARERDPNAGGGSMYRAVNPAWSP